MFPFGQGLQDYNSGSLIGLGTFRENHNWFYIPSQIGIHLRFFDNYNKVFHGPALKGCYIDITISLEYGSWCVA